MESFLPEMSLGWESLGPFPDISGFISRLHEKEAQILPELRDLFQRITAAQCIHMATGESSCLNFFRKNSL